MKKLLFITGTRADFGKIEPLATISKLNGFKVSFFVTGMHLMEKYGLTAIEVARMKGVSRREYLNQREGDGQDQILSNTLQGMSEFFITKKPDLVIIHGDRVEALAAALVSSINGIRSIHIEGGEVSGTIDEVYRHCNTKLCTAHFVSSKEAKKRVVRLGENPESIFILGSPELDIHNKKTGINIDEVKKRYAIPWNDYAIVIFHPVTSEKESIEKQAFSLFNSLKESKKKFVVISPNNDLGSEKIFKVISKLPKSQFRQIPSMRFLYFSELLRNSMAIIGNSSAGVREAPFLGISSLDVGTRQTNRNKSSSITRVEAQNSKKIKYFLENKWGKKHKKDTTFGKGFSSKIFIKILKEKSIWNLPLQKKFFD